MNQTDKNPHYKEIYKFVRESFEATHYFCHGPFDETYYSLRVYESAKEIIGKLNQKNQKSKFNQKSQKSKNNPKISVPLVLVSALLHDIGKSKLNPVKIFSPTGKKEKASQEWNKHAQLSVPLAKKILIEMGHSPEFIEKVCYLIANHDQRGELIKNKSLELQILQDADLIADSGFAGFIRPFLYGSKFNRHIIGTIKYLQKETNRAFQDGLLNLDVSKQIAKGKLELERKLIQEISKDIESELL